MKQPSPPAAGTLPPSQLGHMSFLYGNRKQSPGHWAKPTALLARGQAEAGVQTSRSQPGCALGPLGSFQELVRLGPQTSHPPDCFSPPHFSCLRQASLPLTPAAPYGPPHPKSSDRHLGRNRRSWLPLQGSLPTAMPWCPAQRVTQILTKGSLQPQTRELGQSGKSQACV